MSAATRTAQGAIETVNGSPRYKAAISASNVVAATAITGGDIYMVQSDVDVYVHGASASNGTIIKADGTTTTLTTALGVLVQAFEKFIFTARMDETRLAAIMASGTATVKVFKLEL